MTQSTMRLAKRLAEKEAVRLAGQRSAAPGTRCIALTDWRVTVVDEADYARLSAHQWHITNRGYAATRTGGRVVLMHRMILGLTGQEMADHINGDRLDNRRANLRLVTPSQSSANTSSHKDSTSQFKGVSWSKSRKRWVARIFVRGERHHLGSFANEADAAVAYDRAAARLCGEYAKLNLPNEFHAMKNVLTIGEVAKMCRAKTATVRRWIDQGRLKGYRIPGSQDRRVSRENLIAFLNDNGMPLPLELQDAPAAGGEAT